MGASSRGAHGAGAASRGWGRPHSGSVHMVLLGACREPDAALSRASVNLVS